MSDATQTDPRNKSVPELVLDVSERTSLLVREEIELAKTEITEKVTKLVKGSVVGVVAGIFGLLFLAMFMHAMAWLLNDLFFDDHVWLGFLIEAFIWLGIAIAAGYFAYRSISSSGPPVPTMAIGEAKEIKETLEGGR